MIHFYQNVEGFLTVNHPTFFNKMMELSPDKGVWVEVGSWLGKSISYCVVESMNRNRKYEFHCVDTWEGSEEHQNREVVKSGQLFNKFKNNISLISNYVQLHRMPSVEAAKKFDDESIDCIFIDAAHDYENVKADIEAWYPKMKSGAVIGYDDHTPGQVGVRKAVAEFHEKMGLPAPINIGRAAYVVKP